MRMNQQAKSAMKEGLPKISVCTISFNHAHCIRDCIDGVKKQDYGGEVQHVIADDKSTDQTAKVIEESIREKSSVTYKIINQQKNVGMNQNLIDALSACEGEFIALCEGDDYWINHRKLYEQASFLDNNPGIGMSTHECFRIYYPKKKNRTWRRAIKMVFWDFRLSGVSGPGKLASALIRGPEYFWARDRCHLECMRKNLYTLKDFADGSWHHPFCSIVMRKSVAEDLKESLAKSAGAHQLALLLGSMLGGIRHFKAPMAVKRDQQSSVTLDERRREENRRINADITTNNVINRYRSLLPFADKAQTEIIEKMIEQYVEQNFKLTT